MCHPWGMRKLFIRIIDSTDGDCLSSGGCLGCAQMQSTRSMMMRRFYPTRTINIIPKRFYPIAQRLEWEIKKKNQVHHLLKPRKPRRGFTHQPRVSEAPPWVTWQSETSENTLKGYYKSAPGHQLAADLIPHITLVEIQTVFRQ